MQNGTGDDPELAEQKQNASRFKHEMAQVSGGLLDAETVGVILGFSAQEVVNQAVTERRILAVDDNGLLRFPAFQFVNGQVLSGVGAILKAVPSTNGWRVLQYLYDREEGLHGDRPIDLIQGSASDLERAVRFVRRLEQ